MCGICGILGSSALGAPEREAVVGGMMARMVHRGPDGEGMWSGKGLCLGHRRLAVIDLENGAQPMTAEDGRYVLSFNGEIYNYVELRRRMIEEGVTFHTTSDTEVLLKLLIHRGTAGLDELNGMFAFAFVDRRTGEWLLVRDPFGIKPLYYTTLEDEVVFASEIKAILVHPRVKASPNWKAMQQYLTFQFCLHGETLFRGVRALEPGFYLRGRGSRVTHTVRYWDTDYRIDEDHTEEYFTGRLRELLADSARLQLRSDVPVGAHLSGGVDSGVVASLAAGQLGARLPVFHGRFDEGPDYDESAHAKAVSEAIGAEYHERTIRAVEFPEFLPQLIYSLDEPVAGPGVFPQYMVSRMAAERVKVVLGGQGGDEVFGGYARYLIGYLEQAIKGAIFETQEEGRHVVTLSSIIPNLSLLQRYRPLMQHFWRDGLFGEMDARYFRLIDRSPDVETLLTPAARERFDRDDVFAEFQTVFNHPDTHSYVNKMTHFDQKTLLPALLQVEDRVSMAVSLESRVPLLDKRIVDLITRMPPPVKFQGGQAKYIFKKAVSDLLPRSVCERKDKMGFPVPLHEWMVSGPAREFVLDVFRSQACRERGLFANESLERLVGGEAPFGRQLWGALCLELWHRQFIDGCRAA